MNPLGHFGITNKFIRGDTSSYNNSIKKCPKCGGNNFTQHGQYAGAKITCEDCGHDMGKIRGAND